jgi:hypothetical protein
VLEGPIGIDRRCKLVSYIHQLRSTVYPLAGWLHHSMEFGQGVSCFPLPFFFKKKKRKKESALYSYIPTSAIYTIHDMIASINQTSPVSPLSRSANISLEVR